MKKLLIEAEKINVFSDCSDKHFCLVTNKELKDLIQIKENNHFISNTIYTIDDEYNFEYILHKTLPDNACVLVISPYVFFESPPQKTLGNRRVIAMACNSTPTSIDDIAHFWECLVQTDPQEQQLKTDVFFELGQESQHLRFIDYKNNTEAVFMHMDESYLWSEQTGILNDGEQQLAPSGEISVLPINIQEFDKTLRLDINGTIALHGTPILHNGTPSFTREDQKRIHSNLSKISKSAIIATIKNGEITDIKATSPISQKAVDTLNCMFEIDSRYRILWEIGFGINKNIKLRAGNHAMNETYGAENGCIHFGLGLTPYTQYHLDIICPNMNVLTDNNTTLIGTPKKIKKMNILRNTQGNCLCTEF
ncbi:hypothetical protein IMCC1989_669 [gamma proteobacterium IMCC1989]|nr:hypothetical protein IMCC1989_669 [gamma proteobacterium IMCC1989]